MATAPADVLICKTCKRPLPRPKTTDADAPARGKRWTRLTIVMPEQDDKDAIEEKLEILQARYEQRTEGKVARYVLLDWALQELIDRNIWPGEEGG